MAEFFTRHDLLLCPTACTPPFNVNQRYVSLPCGFTEAGLPVGLQIVGRPRGEAELLSAAAALEEALGPRRPYAIAPRRRGGPVRS